MDRTKDVPEVTQADRERALEAMMLPSDDFLAPHWMSGRCDSGPLLQALSRHRIEATRPLTAEIADLRAQLDEAMEALEQIVPTAHIGEEPSVSTYYVRARAILAKRKQP